VPNQQAAGPQERPAELTNSAASWPACSARPRIAGRKSSPRSGARYQRRPASSSSAARPTPPAAMRSRPWARSTARPSRRSISTRRFFQDLQRKLNACPAGSKTCEFSQAYVIAHEIGHHVQNVHRHPAQGAAGATRHEASATAMPAAGARRIAGRLLRGRLGEPAAEEARRSSTRAMSTPPCRRRARSATTPCSAARRARWCRTPSRTARRRSASNGSRPVSRPGT
jgi:hypothetical protein